jgi:hypothetical protein
MRDSDPDMQGGFLKSLKPGQDAAFEAIRATIAEFGLPRGALSPGALLALFHRILPGGPPT